MTIYASKPHTYKTIHPGDEMFTFVSGLVLMPRASILIDIACPSHYNDVVVHVKFKY